MSSINDTINDMFDNLNVRGLQIGRSPAGSFFIQITQVVPTGEGDPKQDGNVSNIVHQVETSNIPDCFERGRERCQKANRLAPLKVS